MLFFITKEKLPNLKALNKTIFFEQRLVISWTEKPEWLSLLTNRETTWFEGKNIAY